MPTVPTYNRKNISGVPGDALSRLDLESGGRISSAFQRTANNVRNSAKELINASRQNTAMAAEAARNSPLNFAAAQKVAADVIAERDSLKARELDVEYAKAQEAVLFERDGAMSLARKAYLDSLPGTQERLTELREKLLEDASPAVRGLIEDSFNSRDERIRKTLINKAVRERAAYEGELSLARVEAAERLALESSGDAEAVTEFFRTVNSEAVEQARLQGIPLSHPTIQNSILNQRSAFMKKAVDNALNNQQPGLAMKLMAMAGDRSKFRIHPSAQADLFAKIYDSSVLQASQELTDEAVQRHPDDLQAALAYARENSTGKLRQLTEIGVRQQDNTKAMLENRAMQKIRAENYATNQAILQAKQDTMWAVLDGVEGYQIDSTNDIPLEQRRLLRTSDLNRIEKAIKNRDRIDPVNTSVEGWETFQEYVDDPSKLAQADFVDLRSRFADPEFNVLRGLYMKGREPQARSDLKLINSRIDAKVKSLGLDDEKFSTIVGGLKTELYNEVLSEGYDFADKDGMAKAIDKVFDKGKLYDLVRNRDLTPTETAQTYVDEAVDLYDDPRDRRQYLKGKLFGKEREKALRMLESEVSFEEEAARAARTRRIQESKPVVTPPAAFATFDTLMKDQNLLMQANLGTLRSVFADPEYNVLVAERRKAIEQGRGYDSADLKFLNIELNRLDYDPNDPEERGRLLSGMLRIFNEQNPQSDEARRELMTTILENTETYRTFLGINFGKKSDLTTLPVNDQEQVDIIIDKALRTFGDNEALQEEYIRKNAVGVIQREALRKWREAK